MGRRYICTSSEVMWVVNRVRWVLSNPFRENEGREMVGLRPTLDSRKTYRYVPTGDEVTHVLHALGAMRKEFSAFCLHKW